MVNMLGIVMAGGKSSRFGDEKLIQEIHGRKIIDISIENISLSHVENYFIAVSRNAPRTMNYCKKYNIIETPGNGYPEDVLYLLKLFKKPLLLLSGDSIFVNTGIINDFLSRYSGRSMAAVISYNGYRYIGLNIAVPGDEQDIIIEYKTPILALNINTKEDLKEAFNLVGK